MIHRSRGAQGGFQSRNAIVLHGRHATVCFFTRLGAPLAWRIPQNGHTRHDYIKSSTGMFQSNSKWLASSKVVFC